MQQRKIPWQQPLIRLLILYFLAFFVNSLFKKLQKILKYYTLKLKRFEQTLFEEKFDPLNISQTNFNFCEVLNSYCFKFFKKNITKKNTSEAKYV